MTGSITYALARGTLRGTVTGVMSREQALVCQAAYLVFRLDALAVQARAMGREQSLRAVSAHAARRALRRMDTAERHAA